MSQRHVIVGTAGHIDHGKSTLVRALTGIDPDRLAEEKRRGITIDIGFAHLELGEYQVAFIDVPGHERFVKNMLAGIGGVQLVLLVVAADESVMPQTVEHFQICRLLGIRRGIVVLTKADQADDEMRSLVIEEVRELVAGSALETAPILEVDSLSGRGLEKFRQELLRQLQAEESSRLQALADQRFFAMPIDRVFSVKGFGTVVTGTVATGSIGLDAPLEIQPSGLSCKLRGIEVFGAASTQASAGRRTALNLTGVERSQLARGMVVMEPGVGEPSKILDCRLELLLTSRPLRDRSPIRFHHGSSEIVGRVYLMEGDMLEPGQTGFCRIRLQDPAICFPGDHVILRRYSPPATIAGGIILENHPARIRRRELGARLPQLERLAKALDSGVDREPTLLRTIVRGEGIRGIDLRRLAGRTGLRPETLRRLIPGIPGLEWASQEPPVVIWSEALAGREQVAKELLAEFHRSRPLAPGISREELRRKLLPDSAASLFPVLLERLQRGGAIEVQGSLVAALGARPQLSPEQLDIRGELLAWIDANPFQAVSLEDRSRAGGRPVAAVKEIFFYLLQAGELVRINDELVLTRTQLDGVRRRLQDEFPQGRAFTVPQFKDLFGISRKFAIPVLEYLDRERFTRRTGDTRIVV